MYKVYGLKYFQKSMLFDYIYLKKNLLSMILIYARGNCVYNGNFNLLPVYHKALQVLPAFLLSSQHYIKKRKKENTQADWQHSH